MTSSSQELRQLITLEALRTKMETLLVTERRPITEYLAWPAVLTQIRISEADTKWGSASESPHNQLDAIARYCVAYKFCPVEMCFEAASGLRETKARKRLQAAYDQIDSGQLVVTAVVTYNVDRFTRNRQIGEQWFELLKLRGVDLHEADHMKPPKPFAEQEGSYAMKLRWAWRESKRNSDRVLAARRQRERSPHLLLENVDHFGHTVIREEVDGALRQVRGAIVPAEAAAIREAAARILAGETPSAVASDFNHRGVATRRNGDWSHKYLTALLTRPTVIGMQRASSGRLVSRDIEPILNRDDWEALNAQFANKRPRSPSRPTYADLLVCGVCGGACAWRATRAPYYTCATGPCNCRLRADHCGCAVRHASRRHDELSEFLLAVAVAAQSQALRAPGDARAPRHGGEAGLDAGAKLRANLQQELTALDSERRELARALRREPREDGDTRLVAIAARGDDVRRELARLQAPLPRSATLRRPGAGESEHELVRRVVKQCVLAPRATGCLGLSLTFHPPYSMAEDELTALAREMSAAHACERERGYAWTLKVTRASAERAFGMYEQGLALHRIIEHFPEVTGRERLLQMRRALKRICRERGTTLDETNLLDTELPFPSRDLLFGLAHTAPTPYAQVADTLNQMRISLREWRTGDPVRVSSGASGRAEDARLWTATLVEDAYLGECRWRGEAPRPRR